MSVRIRAHNPALILAAVLLPLFVFPAAPAADPCAARRAALTARTGPGIILVPAQIPGTRGGTAQDNKDFLYLTGVSDPEALLVLNTGPDKPAVVYSRSGRWRGRPEAPLETKPLADIRAVLRGLSEESSVHVPFSGLDPVRAAVGGVSALGGAGRLVNLDPILAEMRIVKDAAEIAVLQRAIDLTAAAYVEALKAARPGRTELDLNAVYSYMYARREASSSFTQIASGPNAVNIHFGATKRVLAAGDLIVFDLGAWVDGYTSDISRTIPVGGRFSPEQAALYNVVLTAQKEGIRLMTAGNGVLKTQTAVEDALLAGLGKLGLVTDPASPWQRRLFIQHGFIHGIGLDVHDVWGWFARRMRAGLVFAPGMVLTMEPGLYFPAGRLEKLPAEIKSMVSEADWAAYAAQAGPLYKKYENLGCRIEDDVLVLETGNRVLTAAAPKEIADIEKTMRAASPFLQVK